MNPNWSLYLQAFVVLALTGFALVILSGFWHVLAAVTAAAALLWLWQRSRPK